MMYDNREGIPELWFYSEKGCINSLFVVVCFLLGNSPASEFYMPMFRNTLSHLHRRIDMKNPMKMEQTECSETLAYKIQTLENYPEESIQHSEHGESLKSRISLGSLQFLMFMCSVD